MQSKTKLYRGIVTTFYSYKGGTGRTMALANTACLMALQTKDPILLVDWDLEAPGLHAYFSKFLPKGHEQKEGLIEYCQAAFDTLPDMPLDEENPEVLQQFFEDMMGKYIVQLDDLPNVFLLKAGRFDKTYGARVADFDWQAFFEKIPSFFPLWAKFLRQRFAYVFMDSRTGRGDIPGISTMLMPEKLVLVFTPNTQSLDGVLELAEKAIDYRRHSDDTRPLMIYPLPSRMELGEDALRKQWQQKYTERFEQVLRQAYGLPDTINLSDYFHRVQVPHVPRMAYGEEIVALEETTRDVNSLTARYEVLRQYIFGNEHIWVEPRGGEQRPAKVFMIYAHEDREHKLDIQKYLYPLVRSKVIDLWDDSLVVPGMDWSKVIIKQLYESDIALMLVSADSLNSEFIWEEEFRIARERHEKGEMIIIPIILRHCAWMETPIGNFQALPRDARTISSFKDPSEAYTEIALTIAELAQKTRAITT
jgi:TIR domain